MTQGAMTRQEIEGAFEALDSELGRRGVRGQVYVIGGAVMCLVFRARESTKDVDAWFSPAEEVREAARAVAAELKLPDDWLNDAAKCYLPERASFEAWKTLPNLEISTADPRTLLAMKCAAARTAEDTADIQALAERLGMSSSSDILAVVRSMYPDERLPVRARLLLEEIFDDRG